MNKLPSELFEEYPEIPWKEIIAMRNILIHEYFGVDTELTWAVVKENIVDLKDQLEKIRNNLNK